MSVSEMSSRYEEVPRQGLRFVICIDYGTTYTGENKLPKLIYHDL